MEYEEEKPLEICKTCAYFVYDSWYPGERICDFPYGPDYGETKDAYDRCDWWEQDE